MQRVTHWIDGSDLGRADAATGEVFDPATGQVTRVVELATDREVTAAIDAAKRALPDWSATPALGRARVLFRFKALMDAHADELAALITAEHGKTLPDARGEVTRGIEVIEFACGIPQLMKGEMSHGVGRGIDCWSVREPLGVCAGITPFNFPAMVPLWMFPVAIACGNAFVLKPSERDPSASLLMARLLTEAGAPPGVMNVLQGDRRCVDALIASPDVAAVSFVGSTPVARHVYESGAQHGKRVQALGGAKNHMVVLPDADLDRSVDALMGAAYGSAGERCMAISVAVAVGDIADDLVQRLARRVAGLRVGPGNASDIDMGPLITRAHQERVAGYIDVARKDGATVVVDGREAKLSASCTDGFFLGGTLVDHVTPGMRVYREEIFGPFLCVVRARDLDEALAITNGSEFGNGTSVFTRSGAAARAFADRVHAGMVGINVPIPVPMAFHSFGGWKHSLFGDHHVHGPEGVRFYTRMKTVTARWPEEDASDGSHYVMPTVT